jgi:hypothetical protein
MPRKSQNPNKSLIGTRYLPSAVHVVRSRALFDLTSSCQQPLRQALCYRTIPPPDRHFPRACVSVAGWRSSSNGPDDAGGRSHPTPTGSHFWKKRFPFPAVLCLRLLRRYWLLWRCFLSCKQESKIPKASSSSDLCFFW